MGTRCNRAGDADTKSTADAHTHTQPPRHPLKASEKAHTNVAAEKESRKIKISKKTCIFVCSRARVVRDRTLDKTFPIGNFPLWVPSVHTDTVCTAANTRCFISILISLHSQFTVKISRWNKCVCVCVCAAQRRNENAKCDARCGCVACRCNAVSFFVGSSNTQSHVRKCESQK